MTDTPTELSDIIVPERFNPYFREASTRVNAFFQSGVMRPVDELTFGAKGGFKIEMPFWKALAERAQLLDDNDTLEIKKIESAQDTAVQHARGLVYGATDLSGAFAGDDPMAAIGDGVGENWSTEINLMTFATLKGAMAAMALANKNSVDISALTGAAAYIDGEAFIDANQTMGDNKMKITAVGMHSATNSWLAKQGLIATERDADGKVLYETFMQKRVIVDDALTPDTGVYDTYLFGDGALGWGEGSPKRPSAVDRNELVNGGLEFLVTRRHFVIHPRGVRWTPGSGVPAKATPSDAELATAANWTPVWDNKNIRIIRLRHKIG